MLVLEGKAYLKTGLQNCAIGIEDGKIFSIKKTLRADDRRDYNDMLLLPSGIDIHTHFRDPGLTYKEDFGSGSTAAACGGVTTAFDMPNTLPPTTTARRFAEKLKMAGKKSFIDFGLYGALSIASETKNLAKIAHGFKLYLAPTTGDLCVKTEDLDELLESVQSKGLPVIVHGEDSNKFGEQKATDLVEYNKSRPILAETSSVVLLKEKGKDYHMTHVTCTDMLGLTKGAGITTDVTPHHLLLDCTMNLKARGKVNPPLRPPAEREAMWKAFVEGRIEMVASDHAPHTFEEKELDFLNAPAGIPGVETMMPLLLRKVRSMDLPLERLINAICERPAELMRLSKGRIEEGIDADIVVVDLREIKLVKGKKLHSKCEWTPFEGWEAVFPRAVYLRGNLIVDKGEVVEDVLGKAVPTIASMSSSSEKEESD